MICCGSPGGCPGRLRRGGHRRRSSSVHALLAGQEQSARRARVGWRRRPVGRRDERVGHVHVVLPDAHWVVATMDRVDPPEVRVVQELGDVAHRRLTLGITDPHCRGVLRRRPDEPCVRVERLRPGLAGGRAVVGQAAVATGPAGEHALQHVDRGGRHLRRDDLLRLRLVLVDDLAVRPDDLLDVVRVHVDALVGDGLEGRRHVQRRDLVVPGGQGGIVVQLSLHAELVGEVHHPVEADDLRQPAERAVDRRRGHHGERGHAAAGDGLVVAADLEGVLGITGVGQRARRLTVDDVVGLRARRRSPR